MLPTAVLRWMLHEDLMKSGILFESGRYRQAWTRGDIWRHVRQTNLNDGAISEAACTLRDGESSYPLCSGRWRTCLSIGYRAACRDSIKCIQYSVSAADTVKPSRPRGERRRGCMLAHTFYASWCEVDSIKHTKTESNEEVT